MAVTWTIVILAVTSSSSSTQSSSLGPFVDLGGHHIVNHHDSPPSLFYRTLPSI
ncbi:hypothetical protein PAXRUDRAFT_22400 [Paxillus rubicundulus Ve08.2h10]|uniref:Uncharacterized protein n=1 Tax=Paxillus rubicundulus Ve08.2h10 TaxID=930991 RepID=A0A0D0CN70_9AGAM|nr:hypothetical protein PAXRUDRAFT_22400 [Paxillus rubicundulus Ve08.2h10]